MIVSLGSATKQPGVPGPSQKKSGVRWVSLEVEVKARDRRRPNEAKRARWGRWGWASGGGWGGWVLHGFGKSQVTRVLCGGTLGITLGNIWPPRKTIRIRLNKLT